MEWRWLLPGLAIPSVILAIAVILAPPASDPGIGEPSAVAHQPAPVATAATPAAEARTERCPNGGPPVPRLVEAAACGDAAVMASLLGEGARLDIADPRSGFAGYTALHHAVGRGDQAAIRSLLGAGARADAVDKQGNSPLHLLALGDPVVADDAIARDLVHAGANLTRRNAAGRTPLEELKTRPRLALASDRLRRYLEDTESQLSMVSGARGYLTREPPGVGQFSELDIGGAGVSGVFPITRGSDATSDPAPAAGKQ